MFGQEKKTERNEPEGKKLVDSAFFNHVLRSGVDYRV